jgi:hypothetical protein
MKKLNQYMIIQWLVFLPLILPLSIVSGAVNGIKHAIAGLLDQMESDVYTPITHEENSDFFA